MSQPVNSDAGPLRIRCMAQDETGRGARGDTIISPVIQAKWIALFRLYNRRNGLANISPVIQAKCLADAGPLPFYFLGQCNLLSYMCQLFCFFVQVLSFFFFDNLFVVLSFFITVQVNVISLSNYFDFLCQAFVKFNGTGNKKKFTPTSFRLCNWRNEFFFFICL